MPLHPHPEANPCDSVRIADIVIVEKNSITNGKKYFLSTSMQTDKLLLVLLYKGRERKSSSISIGLHQIQIKIAPKPVTTDSK